MNFFRWPLTKRLVASVGFYLVAFFDCKSQSLPVFFSEYGITLNSTAKRGDTLKYAKSSKEEFRFVFFNDMGECYCERYVGKKLFERGYYAPSLDTLKRYVFARRSNGSADSPTVQMYLEPLKSGEWFTFPLKKKPIKRTYYFGAIKE